MADDRTALAQDIAAFEADITRCAHGLDFTVLRSGFDGLRNRALAFNAKAADADKLPVPAGIDLVVRWRPEEVVAETADERWTHAASGMLANVDADAVATADGVRGMIRGGSGEIVYLVKRNVKVTHTRPQATDIAATVADESVDPTAASAAANTIETIEVLGEVEPPPPPALSTTAGGPVDGEEHVEAAA